MIYHLSFQKIYRGYHPRILTAGGVERVQNVCKCKRPGVRNQTLVPLNFSAVVAPLPPPPAPNISHLASTI